ncbi:unnamed protein product, partial [Sphacelaria rigidula]
GNHQEGGQIRPSRRYWQQSKGWRQTSLRSTNAGSHGVRCGACLDCYAEKTMEDWKKRQAQKTVRKKCDSTDMSLKGGEDVSQGGTTDGGARAMPKDW